MFYFCSVIVSKLIFLVHTNCIFVLCLGEFLFVCFTMFEISSRIESSNVTSTMDVFYAVDDSCFHQLLKYN